MQGASAADHLGATACDAIAARHALAATAAAARQVSALQQHTPYHARACRQIWSYMHLLCHLMLMCVVR